MNGLNGFLVSFSASLALVSWALFFLVKNKKRKKMFKLVSWILSVLALILLIIFLIGKYGKTEKVAVVETPTPPVVEQPVAVKATPPIVTPPVETKQVPIIVKVVETKIIEKPIIVEKVVVVKGENGKDGAKGDPGVKGDPGQPGKDATPPPTPPPQTPPPTPPPQTPAEEVLNFNETLKTSLDEWGWGVSETDRFAVNGTWMDLTLKKGDIVVCNTYRFETKGFVSQNGKCVYFFKATQDGQRVRVLGFDGQWFLIRDGKRTLNQSIAAMRETVIQYHNTDPNDPSYSQLKIQYHELIAE